MTTTNKTTYHVHHMYIAHRDIIESQGVLLSLLRDPENTILETYTSKLSPERNVGDSINLLRLSSGEFAVCDKWQESIYITYMFLAEDEEEARECFDTTVDECKKDESC